MFQVSKTYFALKLYSPLNYYTFKLAMYRNSLAFNSSNRLGRFSKAPSTLKQTFKVSL